MDAHGSVGSKGQRLAPTSQRVSWGVEEGSAGSAAVDVDLKPRTTALKASVRRAGARRPSEDHADSPYADASKGAAAGEKLSRFATHVNDKVFGCAEARLGPARTLPHAWSHLVMNLTILAVEWKLLLLGVGWQLVHSTATNVVYYLEATRMTGAQRLPLHDLGFEVLPLLSGYMWGLSDLLLISIIVFVVAMVPLSLVVAFRTPDRKPLFIAFAARRFFLSLIILQTLRMVSFTVTLLPGSSYQCLYTLTDAQKASAAGSLAEGLAAPEGNSDAWNPPRTLHDVVFTADAWTGCGDLMFSSHMIFAMLCCMTVRRYCPWRAAQRCVLAAVLVMVPLTLAARKHYTLDVFTSLYVVPCVYELLYLKFPDQDDRESMKHRYGIAFQKVDHAGNGASSSSSSSYVAVVAKKAHPVAVEQLPWDMGSAPCEADLSLGDADADVEAGEASALFAAAVSSATGKPAQFVV